MNVSPRSVVAPSYPFFASMQQAVIEVERVMYKISHIRPIGLTVEEEGRPNYDSFVGKRKW